MTEPKKRAYGLRDILPEMQGGNFNTEYDVSFEKAADKYNVPFALLKAHAIVESSLNPDAFRDESNTGKNRQGWASRGLMQLLWWPGSQRFIQYGYADKDIGSDGGSLYDPDINADIAAQLIADNLDACRGNIRDAINMYNTGAKESVRVAPGGYTDKVFKNYKTLIKE